MENKNQMNDKWKGRADLSKEMKRTTIIKKINGNKNNDWENEQQLKINKIRS